MDTDDEEVAARVRERLHQHDDLGVIEERKMFGALAFMVRGHMTVAASGQGGLLVRVLADDIDDLVTRDHVERMVMGDRRSKTWVRVGLEALESDADLDEWLGRGLAVVRRLPPKGGA